MKKIAIKLLMVVAAIMLLTGCGISPNLTSNLNVNQTNVTLTQKNFHIVKTVESKVSATYIFGIGGLGKRALQNNAVAELTQKANLTGSQALVNVTLKYAVKSFVVFNQVTYYAEGTVIEFDK